MDHENKSCASEPITEDDMAFNENTKDEIIVPDDAYANDDLEESKKSNTSEMLPQSLSDDEDAFLDDENELFTDEELASLPSQKQTETKETESDFESASSSDEVNENSDQNAEPNSNGSTSATRRIDSCFDILEMFVFALAFVLVAMAFFFRHSVVDGGSMENTLYDKEHLIISDLFYSPKQGDIVVIQDASKAGVHNTLAKPIVKRVIATEGQTVMIRSNGEVYVDGELLDESAYIFIDDPYYQYNELPLTTVPEGCVFLMGDHRNVSLDSRSAAGTFSEDAILGKVILRFFPFDRFGAVK
ncbi:MAG: signal peptidase I [Clostridia bacterium]|nr:signal peptidase I [Clostridia bacterium]